MHSPPDSHLILGLWLEFEDKYLAIDGKSAPLEVQQRACFWATMKFRHVRLSNELEDMKKRLFREHYMAMHPALATYLEWQRER